MKKNLLHHALPAAFLFCLHLCCAPILAFAQNAGASANLPSVEPLFVYDAGPSFGDEDIIKSALEFSECPVSSAEALSVLSRYAQLRQEVTSPSFAVLSQSERAEKILSHIYEKILVAYGEDQTKINVLFKTGTYNCVSSSVLYLALAKAASLDVRGQVTPTHAFCTLYITDGSAGGKAKIDVETTNPYGFNPGSRRNVDGGDTSKGGRYAIVPKRNYNGRHEVEDKVFVSLVGQNVSSAYDKAGNWHKAIPMAAAGVAFTKDCKPSFNTNRQEFEKSCTNFVSVLQRENQFGTILEWLDSLYERWGAEKHLQNTYEKSVSNYANALCRTGSFSAAKECLELRRKRVGAQMQSRIEQMIFESEMQWHLDEASGNDEAIEYLQGIRQLEIAKSPRNTALIKQRLEYYWIRKINEAQAEGKFLYAASIADEGLKSVPSSGAIAGAKKTCLRNHDMLYHNAFADFANKKQYDRALDALNEGLRGNPQSQTLNSDLKRLQGMMNSQN